MMFMLDKGVGVVSKMALLQGSRMITVKAFVVVYASTTAVKVNEYVPISASVAPVTRT